MQMTKPSFSAVGVELVTPARRSCIFMAAKLKPEAMELS